jgi:ABC-type uncharacterized transport system substrate-binding protein
LAPKKDDDITFSNTVVASDTNFSRLRGTHDFAANRLRWSQPNQSLWASPVCPGTIAAVPNKNECSGGARWSVRQLAAAIVAQGPMFFIERRRIAQLAIDRKLPTMAASDVFTDGGFLMSYGADWPPLFKAVPSYVDKLLKGAKPADLPVQQPTSFEFIINMQTAQSVGVQIPASIQLLASRVIE